MDTGTIRLIVELTKAKVDILRLKADDYTWQCHTDGDTKAQLEATLLDINSQLAELRSNAQGNSPASANTDKEEKMTTENVEKGTSGGSELTVGLGDMADEYRIKNTGKGADWFGKCERCGKHCATHYKQQRKTNKGWTNAGYGHVECLRNGPWADAPVDHSA